MVPDSIPECQFQYAGGRHCRRIPKRGAAFCRDHRRIVRALPAPASGSSRDPRPARHEHALLRLGGLGLDQLVLEISRSLQALEPLVRGSASSEEFFRYQSARTAAEFAIDRVASLPHSLRRVMRNLHPDHFAMICRLLMYAGPNSANL
ncbi:MAG TPA: hypothetical protein VME68_17505 [Acidobacteriaceae bacterium]|nr:hypothetical protein [Acidobacteriaceae bacterium]